MIVMGFRVMRGSLRGIEEGTFFSNYAAMGYGALIESGARCWQIFQQQNGTADISLSGSWFFVEENGLETVYVKIVDEMDGHVIVPYTKCDMLPGRKWIVQLPSATAEGATLSWNSLSPEVIHISGSQAAVTRQSAAAAVTLVAQVEFSGSTAQRHFILKVPRQDSSGGGSSGGGGGTGKPPAIQNFEYTVSEEEPESAVAFPDLSSVGWARESIKLLAANGIFQGRPDGTFDPGAPVMREEFVKILCAAFRLPESKQKAAFSDVDAEAWYAPYIASAAEAGIINGMGDGRFGAGMPVARQDIAVMLVRAAETLGYALPDSEETSVFSDSQDIALYAADSVRKLKALEAANGDEQNQFLPKRHASRAETAKLVCIVLQKLNLLA